LLNKEERLLKPLKKPIKHIKENLNQELMLLLKLDLPWLKNTRPNLRNNYPMLLKNKRKLLKNNKKSKPIPEKKRLRRKLEPKLFC